MQTHNTTQNGQAAAADRNDAAATPRALSDLKLATVVGGVSEIVITKPTDCHSTNLF